MQVYANNYQQEGDCDADNAEDQTFNSGGAISWSSKLQPTLAASTMEAERTASAQAVTGALWKLLWDFETRAIKVFSDEQGAVKSL